VSEKCGHAAGCHAGRRRGVAHRRLPIFALALLLLTTGCAASAALRSGIDAERRQDYDLAVVEYTKAVRLRPNDTDARLGLERARLRAAGEHFQRGRRLAALGRYDQALVEYELASELNPTSGDIDTELRATRSQLRSNAAVAREGKTPLQTLIEASRDFPTPGLELPPDAKMPASLMFREASSREVFLSIAKFADISLAFDPAFREAPVTVDLRNATLEDALGAIAGLTRTFFRVTAPRTVLVVPDTPAKRREYEEEVVRTLYLSNADLKETMDLLRMVLDARRISPTTGINALTIKDTPERITAAARLLSAIDKARPEVIIDVELLEVDRTRLQEYGLQLASPTSAPTGIDGSVSVAADDNQTLSLRSLRNLTQADVLLANLPRLYYRLLKTDANTRTLANPQLRTAEGMPAQARFGERVPVPVTTFSPFAAGGTPQQPITSFNYENIGVNIDITPRTHHDDDVTLVLKVAVQSISGTGFGDLPTFGNREINTVIRLKDGETNMLAGLIRDDERRVLNGVPGLSDIPVIGRLFAHNRLQTTQTDIILTLTPHIIRVLDVKDADLRAFRVGRETLSPLSDLPLPVPLPPAPQPQPQEPPAAPAIPPGPVTPVVPPAPPAPPVAPPGAPPGH
jgi:general secretion pathway protein D